MIGLMELLDRIRLAWQSNKETLIDSADSIIEAIEPHFNLGDRKDELSKEVIDQAYRELNSVFDDVYGGFGHSPKFPTPHNLSFLLRYWKLTGEDKALDIVKKTLDGMYRGGIFDHIGYGFSRYSTDQKWLVPHFEKMLYDNALLAIAYLEAYQVTLKEEYAKVAEKIFTYILRDMTHPQGGFYSAEDADSEGVEGKFYVWTPKEIEDILGQEDGKFFCRYYGITERGNFEGKSIPNRIHAEKFIDEDSYGYEDQDQDQDKIHLLRDKVFREREKRIHPHKDDKILTSWNGLMIAALAIGARVLNRPKYIDASKKALAFIFNNLVNKEGRLLARYRDMDAAHLAYLDDYAFLIWALIEMYQTTFDAKYLSKAIKLNSQMLNLFNDEENGGMFLYAKDSEELIARPKEIYDGALPSGNSVAALNMLRLARITGNFELEERAYGQLNAFAQVVESRPSGHTHFLMAAMFALYPTKEIVLAGNSRDVDMQKMVALIHKSFLPQTVVIFNEIDSEDGLIRELASYIGDQLPLEGRATAYICENYACQAPVNSLSELQKHVNIAH